jgi:hypothetical protein
MLSKQKQPFSGSKNLLLRYQVPCLQVVTEPTPFEGGIVAISNFGFGGTNVHLLIKGGSGRRTSFSNAGTASGKLLSVCL